MAYYDRYINTDIPWVGEIPSHWRVMRGKTILSLLSRPAADNDEIITCFRDGEVTLRKNRREDGFTVSLQEIGYQGIEPGDLVVHGMDGFAGAIGISDSRGKSTPVLNVMDSSENKRFLMYYLRAAAYKDVFMSLSTGIRVRSCDLRWNKLSVFPFVLPTEEEQAQIVAFLDHKLEELNNLIKEAKASIEEYKAWKASIIYEAVTKGLDPNVEKEDSGVAWIGKMPTTWQLVAAKHVVSINHGTDPKTEGDVPVYGSGSASFRSCGEFKEGPAVLIGRKGATLHIPHYIEGRYWNVDTAFDVKPKNNHFLLRFYYYLATCFDYKYYISQTTLPSMTQTDYYSMKLPYPALQEQKAIVSFLDIRCTQLDSLIKEKEALLRDLESYKKSLIFEVVTGKRKVC